jgi:hypothetical protein
MKTDPSQLRLTPEDIAALTPRTYSTTKAKKSGFTIFPDAWDDQLARVKANGCTYRVAIHLLREAWRTGNNRVKLANVTLGGRNVSRWGKQRALGQLVAAGLISIDQPSRKSPIVMVKFMD